MDDNDKILYFLKKVYMFKILIQDYSYNMLLNLKIVQRFNRVPQEHHLFEITKVRLG